MPNIKPISDLRNYSEVLHDVAVGAPVFLTKNGQGKYAIVDIKDYEKMQATLRLMNELAKGRKSGEEKGWLSLDLPQGHKLIRTPLRLRLSGITNYPIS